MELSVAFLVSSIGLDSGLFNLSAQRSQLLKLEF